MSFGVIIDLMPESAEVSVIKDWRSNPKAIGKFHFLYHFLPHPEEKRRATLLANRSIVLYCILIVFVAFLFRLIPKIMPGVLGYASNITVNDLLKYTNQRREEAGLSDLRLNEALTNSAMSKAGSMFKNNYWAHIAPDGTEPWSFILKQGYDYAYAGENLAKNFSTSKDVVDAWFDSSSHRENLLSANYDEVGFAVVNGVLDGYETTLVVQMFGRPRDVKQIATESEERRVLEEAAKNVSTVSSVPSVHAPAYRPQPAQVLPIVDISLASKTVSLTFALFVAALLTLDIWYSKRKGILKFTGHTVAHLILLVVVILSIWLVLKPGTIL